MNKKTANDALIGIYNALQGIPVRGEQDTFMMSGIFQALHALMQWVNDMKDEGEKENGDKKHI